MEEQKSASDFETVEESSADVPIEKQKTVIRKGYGSWVLWLLVITLLFLIVSGIINVVALGALAASGADSSSTSGLKNASEVYVMGNKRSKNKVLSIPVNGTIIDSGEQTVKKNMVLRVRAELEQAEKDSNIKAVILTINSPGGGITATDIIWNDLKNFKKRTNIPVIAYCQDVTASGGYYLASQCDYIIASQTSLVGSIGVIMQLANVEGLFGKIGLKMNVFTSKTWDGKKSFKDIGSPTRPMTPEEQAILQGLIQNMWTRFVDVVADGRKGKLSRHEVEMLADGKIYVGTDALKKKLIDATGYKEDAFKKAMELAKLSDSQMVEYKHASGFWSELMESKYGASPLLPSPQKMMEEVITPKLMYLWVI